MPTQPTETCPLANQTPALVFVYAHDGNKNVSDVFFLALQNGVGAHYDYAPFGAIVRSSRATPATAVNIIEENPFRFSSEFYDSELGLVYYNYRHYSPDLGRFLSRDPVEEQGGLNLYAFCGNNAISRTDFIGRVAPDCEVSYVIQLINKIQESGRVDNRMAHKYCDDYLKNKNAKCCRDGKLVSDDYISKAQSMCHQFVEKYSYNQKVIEPVVCRKVFV